MSADGSATPPSAVAEPSRAVWLNRAGRGIGGGLATSGTTRTADSSPRSPLTTACSKTRTCTSTTQEARAVPWSSSTDGRCPARRSRGRSPCCTPRATALSATTAAASVGATSEDGLYLRHAHGGLAHRAGRPGPECCDRRRVLMGGGEVARYFSLYGADRLRSVVFASAVPPHLIRTDDNPDAHPGRGRVDDGEPDRGSRSGQPARGGCRDRLRGGRTAPRRSRCRSRSCGRRRPGKVA